MVLFPGAKLGQQARLEADLTDDLAALEAAVARVAERGSDGTSSFAPAMNESKSSTSSPGSMTIAARVVSQPTTNPFFMNGGAAAVSRITRVG